MRRLRMNLTVVCSHSNWTVFLNYIQQRRMEKRSAFRHRAASNVQTITQYHIGQRHR